MFVRVIAEVAVVNRALVAHVAPAIVTLAVAGLGVAAVLQRRRRATPASAEVATAKNPLELRVAIQFALLYAVITLGARAAQLYFGDAGLYAAGALAGLSDVDAITLSMANFAREQPEQAGVAARTIAIATLSNTAAKCGLVFALGAPALRRDMLPIAALLGLAGLVGVWLAL
jgi:uncharacterized membrane protein (DUF4010 family)